MSETLETLRLALRLPVPWTPYDGDGMNNHPMNSPLRSIDAVLWTNVRIACTSARKLEIRVGRTVRRR